MTNNLTVPEKALVEALIVGLKKRLDDNLKGVRTDMQQTLEDAGIERLSVKLPSGLKVGSITTSAPGKKPEITDEAAFTRFVEEFAPTEVMTIKVVRPSYAKKLLDEMEARGAAEIVDPEHHEIIEVDGAEMKEGRAASHSVTWEKEGLDILAAAWRAGELDHIDGLPQLTSGGAQ
ncbi:hypothetical protein ABZ619_39175 [Streptomyces sp. NPDC007851]|uniref:hypothetical protein n=1 Tax=Streptomyces sp. NPDC007851 TaxID=3155008 RepID=UPI0033DD5C65